VFERIRQGLSSAGGCLCQRSRLSASLRASRSHCCGMNATCPTRAGEGWSSARCARRPGGNGPTMAKYTRHGNPKDLRSLHRRRRPAMAPADGRLPTQLGATQACVSLISRFIQGAACHCRRLVPVPKVPARLAGCFTVGLGLCGGGLCGCLLVKPREFSQRCLLRSL
jgi:hypothetical protein